MKNMTDGMTAAAIENNRDIEIYLEFCILPLSQEVFSFFVEGLYLLGLPTV